MAILGDGLKYKSLTMNATDAQLIEQLRWTGENVCATFHVPNYKIGAGPPPSLDNIEALERQYYAQALQTLFECIELLLDEGLELSREGSRTLGVEFDLDDLLRMDSKTLIKSEARAVGAGIRTPNEARKRLNTGPVQGGDTPYLQQQNFSLAALDKRDKLDDPFSAPKVSKTITTRKDENGNLVADVIEHHGVPATGGVKASGSDAKSMESIARRVAKETAGSVDLRIRVRRRAVPDHQADVRGRAGRQGVLRPSHSAGSRGLDRRALRCWGRGYIPGQLLDSPALHVRPTRHG